MSSSLKIYVAKLGELPWSKALLFALLAAGGYYALLYSDGSDLQARGQDIKQQVAQAQEVLAATKKKMENADKFKAEVEGLALRLKQVAEVMPKEMGAAELTNLISSQASASGMRVIKVEPISSVERLEFYETARVKFALNGSYMNALTFLSLMTKVPKLLTYEDIELVLLSSENPERPEISLSGKIAGYRYFGFDSAMSKDSSQAPAGGAEGGSNEKQ